MTEHQEKYRNDELRIRKTLYKDFSQSGRRHLHKKTGQTLGNSSNSRLFLPNIVFETPSGQYTINGIVDRERSSELEQAESDIYMSKGETIIKKGLWLDKNDLMRNFPLSYFENVDLLYKLVGPKRKFQTRSCKNVKKTVKGQQQKQAKKGETLSNQYAKPDGERFGSLGEKENSLRQKYSNVFTAKRFQKALNEGKDKSKVLSQNKLKGRNQNQSQKYNQLAQENFQHQRSNEHSDSRDTLHSYAIFYPKLHHKQPQLNQTHGQLLKVQKDIELVINQKHSPKLNIESSDKRISRQNIIIYHQLKNKITPQKHKMAEQKRQNHSERKMETQYKGKISQKHLTYRNSQIVENFQVKAESRALKPTKISNRKGINQQADKIAENNIKISNFQITQDQHQVLKIEEDLQDKKTVKIGHQSRFQNKNVQISQYQRKNIQTPKFQLNTVETNNEKSARSHQSKQRKLTSNNEPGFTQIRQKSEIKRHYKNKKPAQKSFQGQEITSKLSISRKKSNKNGRNSNFTNRTSKLSSKSRGKLQHQQPAEIKMQNTKNTCRIQAIQKVNLNDSEGYDIKPCVLQNRNYDKKDKIPNPLQLQRPIQMLQQSDVNKLMIQELQKQRNIDHFQENRSGQNSQQYLKQIEKIVKISSKQEEDEENEEEKEKEKEEEEFRSKNILLANQLSKKIEKKAKNSLSANQMLEAENENIRSFCNQQLSSAILKHQACKSVQISSNNIQVIQQSFDPLELKFKSAQIQSQITPTHQKYKRNKVNNCNMDQGSQNYQEQVQIQHIQHHRIQKEQQNILQSAIQDRKQPVSMTSQKIISQASCQIIGSYHIKEDDIPQSLSKAAKSKAKQLQNMVQQQRKSLAQMVQITFFHTLPDDQQTNTLSRQKQQAEITAALSCHNIIQPTACPISYNKIYPKSIDPIRQPDLLPQAKVKNATILHSQHGSLDTQEMNYFYNELIQLDNTPNKELSAFHIQYQVIEKSKIEQRMKAKACSSEVLIANSCDVKLGLAEQKKSINQEQSLPKASQKSVENVLIPFTDSADCISSNSLIKNLPNLDKNISIGSRASIFSLQSENQRVTKQGQNQKGINIGQNCHRNQIKQVTILEQFDQEMLNQSGMIQNNKFKKLQKREQKPIIEEKHDYKEHSSIQQSTVFIDLLKCPQKPIDIQPPIASVHQMMGENIFDLNNTLKTPEQSSFFQLNSQQQAQIDRGLHDLKLKPQNSISENKNIVNKEDYQKSLQAKKQGIQQFDGTSVLKVVVKSRGSCLKMSNHAQHSHREMNLKNSQSMKELKKSTHQKAILQKKIQQAQQNHEIISEGKDIVGQLQQEQKTVNQQKKLIEKEHQRQINAIQSQHCLNMIAQGINKEDNNIGTNRLQKVEQNQQKEQLHSNNINFNQNKTHLIQKKGDTKVNKRGKSDNIGLHKIYDINIMNSYIQAFHPAKQTQKVELTSQKSEQPAKHLDQAQFQRGQNYHKISQSKIETQYKNFQSQAIDKLANTAAEPQNKIQGEQARKVAQNINKTDDIIMTKHKNQQNLKQVSQMKNTEQVKFEQKNQFGQYSQAKLGQSKMANELTNSREILLQKPIESNQEIKYKLQPTLQNKKEIQIESAKPVPKTTEEDKSRSNDNKQFMVNFTESYPSKKEMQPQRQPTNSLPNINFAQKCQEQKHGQNKKLTDILKQPKNMLNEQQQKKDQDWKVSQSCVHLNNTDRSNKSLKIKKLKQISCKLQEKYIDQGYHTQKKQLKVTSNGKIRPGNSLQIYFQRQNAQHHVSKTDQILEKQNKTLIQTKGRISSPKMPIQSSKFQNFGAEIRRDTLLSSQQAAPLKTDAQTNTLQPLQSCDQQKFYTSYKEVCFLAQISQYCKNFSLKVHKLPQGSYELNEKCWQMIKKIIYFIDNRGYFYKRLIDRQSVWLFTDQTNNTFQRFQKGKQFASQEQLIKQTMRRFLGNKVRKDKNIYQLSQQRIVKMYFQILFGMPVLLLKATCYNKLDNLYKHNNIFGFTFGKKTVWRIVGTVQSKKEKDQKLIRLEKLDTKELIEISWTRFLSDFNCSFISGFFENYYNRAISFHHFKKGKQPGETFSARLKVPVEGDSSKKHFLMGARVETNNDEEVNGKIMVYMKVKSEKQKQEHFKYLGSGDIFLLSMKLKPGEYLIVIEFQPKQECVYSGKILMGSQLRNAQINLEEK